MEKTTKKYINKQSRCIICTPDQSAKNTFFFVQEIGILKPDDADAAVSRQNVDSFLIGAVVSGRGELSADGECHPLIKGDCFFVDCRQPYNYKSSEDDPWEIMWVHFNGATSKQYYEYFSSRSKSIFHPQFFDRVAASVSEIIDIYEHGRNYGEILCSKHIMDILTVALTSADNTQHYDSGLKEKLAMVHAYIEDHFSEDLSLEKLSLEFYISKFYLTREYKKIYGKTIFQHIITARINYGKKLLRFSDRSIEEIARMCGFNDQRYFARQFKKAENQTCLSYRKLWREKEENKNG